MNNLNHVQEHGQMLLSEAHWQKLFVAFRKEYNIIQKQHTDLGSQIVSSLSGSAAAKAHETFFNILSSNKTAAQNKDFALDTALFRYIFFPRGGIPSNYAHYPKRGYFGRVSTDCIGVAINCGGWNVIFDKGGSVTWETEFWEPSGWMEHYYDNSLRSLIQDYISRAIAYRDEKYLPGNPIALITEQGRKLSEDISKPEEIVYSGANVLQKMRAHVLTAKGQVAARSITSANILLKNKGNRYYSALQTEAFEKGKWEVKNCQVFKHEPHQEIAMAYLFKEDIRNGNVIEASPYYSKINVLPKFFPQPGLFVDYDRIIKTRDKFDVEKIDQTKATKLALDPSYFMFPIDNLEDACIFDSESRTIRSLIANKTFDNTSLKSVSESIYKAFNRCQFVGEWSDKPGLFSAWDIIMTGGQSLEQSFSIRNKILSDQFRKFSGTHFDVIQSPTNKQDRQNLIALAVKHNISNMLFISSIGEYYAYTIYEEGTFKFFCKEGVTHLLNDKSVEIGSIPGEIIESEGNLAIVRYRSIANGKLVSPKLHGVRKVDA
jgi:hypothetical protein